MDFQTAASKAMQIMESKTLLKKMANNIYTRKDNNDKKFCEYKRPHLVKWFDENFTIDKTTAVVTLIH